MADCLNDRQIVTGKTEVGCQHENKEMGEELRWGCWTWAVSEVLALQLLKRLLSSRH